MTKHFIAIAGLLLIVSANQAQTLDPNKIKTRNPGYVSYKRLKVFPTPILAYVNDKPAYEKLKIRVVNRIVYPMLCESAEPIAVVTVNFCPEIPGSNERGCKDDDKDKLTIMVEIRRQGGSGFMSMIDTDLEGNFDDYAYLTLFTGGERDYVVRNKRCAPPKLARSKR
jgi:hypothetical protein